ncbi:MAG: hypothetical protein J6X55_02310 [Victivallales bacterium]|nr:hypothetical protein [Victivallales bacterium]
MSSSDIHLSSDFPPAPARVFCIGIGGIGVSGLAQLLVSQGYSVAGSDRGLDDSSKAHLYGKLQVQGIRLYPQDGSGISAEHPAVLVISAAVEAGNPDLRAAEGIPVVHRARALAQTLDRTGAIQIAIAGTCGKTSVTGWIADALHQLGHRIVMVNGGYCLDAESASLPGNYFADPNPEFTVAEIDESDKSLSVFTPDFGVLLNIGNDHYSIDELQDVFRGFLSKCSRGITVLNELKELASNCSVPISTFAPEVQDKAIPLRDNSWPGSRFVFDHLISQDKAVSPRGYSSDASGITFSAGDDITIHSSQSGRHSALNACAVFALLKQLPINASDQELAAAIGHFGGIRQRFEVVGKNANGIPVVNDYAHNPEKLEAAIAAAHERFGSPILAIFQPHGFQPLRNMREPLSQMLPDMLQSGDQLLLLPVFYAGGTAAFSPTSNEVADEFKRLGLPVEAVSREDARTIADTVADASCILVMGARDASLRTWSIEMTK